MIKLKPVINSSVVLKTYLAVPLANNRDKRLAKDVFEFLKGLNCEIISEWVLWDDPNPNLKPAEVYQRDFKAIKSCDLLIAEVSNPSIGVGMEIMVASTLGKKIICVNNEKKISNFLRGMPEITIISYANLDELKEKLRSQISGKDQETV